MPIVGANGLDLYYEEFGAPDDPVLLAISGWSAQLVSWDEELCRGFTDRGFRVIRFDNRDVGLSTKVAVDPELDLLEAIMAALSGGPAAAPYHLTDMAADAIGLLDALGVEVAHVVGRSMGGMIAQVMAIEHPARVQSLVSIMSTTGDPDVGHPDPDLLGLLVEPPPADRDGAIDHAVAIARRIGSPEHFDEEGARARATLEYDRGIYPAGIGHQLLAVLSSPSRTPALRNLSVPTLVVHGTADPLIDPSGGERTAEAVPGAELLLLDGMGHDLPPFFWSPVIEAVTALAARAA